MVGIPPTGFTVQRADPPGQGDVFELALALPFGPGDVFEFRTRGEYVDAGLAQSEFETQEPFVVPNPYVAAASFEPEHGEDGHHTVYGPS